MKLTILLHLVRRQKCMELYVHSCAHINVVNYRLRLCTFHSVIVPSKFAIWVAHSVTMSTIWSVIAFVSLANHRTNNTMKYVEIKCQLDATEDFIADLIACSTCFGHHYAHHQELKSIYSDYCLWYFVPWFSSCWSGVELRVMCPVCRMHEIPQAATTV